MTPNILPLVEATAAEFPHLLERNTFDSCGLFTAIVVARAGDGWGHVGKSAGERGWDPPGAPRVSHDAIWHGPTNQQVDILGNAGATDEGTGGVARPTWGVIPKHEYRAGNEWVPPVLSIPTPAPQPEPEPTPNPVPIPPVPPPAPPSFDLALAFSNLWARLDQLQADMNVALHRIKAIENNQHRFTDEAKAHVSTERDFLHQRLAEVRSEVVAAVQQIDKDASCVLAKVRR